MTGLGASRHMNSMASWSPSQSEPLTVSYIAAVPVIFRRVARAGGDAALVPPPCANGLEDLVRHGGLEAGFRQLDYGAQTGAAGAYDHRVKVRTVTLDQSLQMICTAQPA